MGRIWRGLKLGMKSLLLHKLRSGLTVLGIVFGVAAVISMLAIAEGTSREAREQIQALGATNIIIRSVKPSDEAQATTSGRPTMILNYGLKYSDFDRMRRDDPHDPQDPADPRDPQADPPRLATPSRAAWSAPPKTTPTSTCCKIEKGRFLTASDNEKYQNYAVLAAETAAEALPVRGPAQPVGQARHRLLHGRRRHGQAGQLGGDRRQPGRRRTSTRTSTSRSTPASCGSASGSSTTGRARGRPRRRSSPRSRSRSARSTTCCPPCR